MSVYSDEALPPDFNTSTAKPSYIKQAKSKKKMQIDNTGLPRLLKLYTLLPARLTNAAS
jgi:hypothetical protein